MLSCDYNGWNDTPEDEREALDAYEAAAEKARVTEAIAHVLTHLLGRLPPTLVFSTVAPAMQTMTWASFWSTGIAVDWEMQLLRATGYARAQRF